MPLASGEHNHPLDRRQAGRWEVALYWFLHGVNGARHSIRKAAAPCASQFLI